ncbi:hypothetical protein [Donghicola mangrovi]|uniref:Peptidase metallopeptidase domain-containing protein n=1 Tax=Donghicola mangrovi TaxID=2729614 RepID=A0A850QBL0_9RHOB|nr:hypothetical protein [Donghicola mangrovi]NVO24328.1 hypothetical protein [Donghicola mangrovi]
MRRGSVSDMVDFVRNGYWEEALTVPGDGHWRKFNFSSSGDHAKNNHLTVHFDEDDSIPEEMKKIVREAFGYVADVLNITISYRVGDGDDGDVNIHKEDFLDWGTDYAHAEPDLGWFGDAGYYQVNPDILYEPDAFDFDDPYAHHNYVITFIHEMSHLLGLGHLGTYNGSGDHGSARTFTNDSSGWSIMSYIEPDEFGQDGFGFSHRAAGYREVDLRALALTYNIDFSMEEDDTRWGFNGTASHDFLNDVFDVRFDQRQLEQGFHNTPGLTIIDTGGHDTLNLRSSEVDLSYGSVVRLKPNSYSDIVAGTRNLYIFDGSIIEDVISDDGADKIYANSAANMVEAGGGNDTIRGYGGKDTLYGEANDDKLYGDGGNDMLYGGDGDDTLIGGNGKDTLIADDGVDLVYGGRGADTIWVTDGGTFDGQQQNDTMIINQISSKNYTLIGGNGRDILKFNSTDLVVGFKLDLGTHLITEYSTGNAKVVDFSGFEKILGSAKNDLFILEQDSDNNFTFVDGALGDDEIRVNTGSITVTGGLGEDVLKVLAGDNVVRGGENDDTFKVYEVLSTIDGQDGSDGVLFNHFGTRLVSINTDNNRYAYDVGLDNLTPRNSGRIKNFEQINVELSLALMFSGREADETVTGGNQDDTILGKGGDDKLYGGIGSDSIEGGEGADVLYGGNDGDTLIGGAGDDTIYGENGADEIYTGPGDDRVESGRGSDTIYAGSGTDTLEGGGGQDWFYVETGEKFIDGGDDYDRLIFLGKMNRVVTLEDLKYDDENGLIVSYANIEEVETRDGDDSITGSSGDNLLVANDGLDTVQGGMGDDTMYGGAGWDTLQFGTEADITVNLAESTASGEGTDEIYGFETVITNGGNDTIIGDDSDNSLVAGDGEDRLVAAGGTDQLYGGAGSDTLIAGIGTDYVYGEDGFDYLGFDDAIQGVTFNLGLTRAQNTGEGTIRVDGVEGLIGTSYGDYLTGGSDDNIIYGEGGRDTLQGGLGNDTLYGGAGSDTFVYTAGDGNDMYYGGAGNDWVDFSNFDESLWIHLARGSIIPGDLEGDVWDSIECVRGGTAGDTIYGSGGDNALDGSKGNDTLYGLSGNDELLGGIGDDELNGGADNDILTGGEGADRFVMETNPGWDIITDFNGDEGDTLVFTYMPEYADAGRMGMDSTFAPTSALPGQVDIIDGMLTLILSDQDFVSFKGIDDIEEIRPYIVYEIF